MELTSSDAVVVSKPRLQLFGTKETVNFLLLKRLTFSSHHDYYRPF
jgi:hypothetical protein